MYGVFHALFRGPNSHNSVWKDTDQLKIVFYRLTPRTKAYSLTFLYDDFMMYKGLYNFQLYSLHKQSILMYLGVKSQTIKRFVATLKRRPSLKIHATVDTSLDLSDQWFLKLVYSLRSSYS